MLHAPRFGANLLVMHSRALRVALLVFEALWLNVIVPGHQRGIVCLPGESCSAQACAVPDCCNDQPTAPPAPEKDKPSGDPAKHCAICYFAARLCTPPVIDLTPPPLRAIEELPFPAPEKRQAPEFLCAYYGRAPPADISLSA